MTHKQQEPWKDMMTEVRTGRMSRRAFMAKTAALGISTSAAITLLEACGGASGSADSGPVTLTIWDYFNPPGAGYLQLLADYSKAKPNVKIQRTAIPFADLKQKIIQGAAARQLPDILVIDNPDHQAFSSMGILADLTSQISSWGQGNEYITGPWTSTTWKNKNYGIPNNSNCLALYYNADMLKKAGVNPPTNWDELHDATKKLTTKGVYGLSMSLVQSEEGTFQFLPFLWEAGADLNSLDSPEATTALQFLVDLTKERLLSMDALNWTQQDAMTQWTAGKSALCINGPWNLPAARSNAKFNWDVVPLPKNKQAASILGGENWTITATSQHQAEAWEFIKWTQELSVLKKCLLGNGTLPSRLDLGTDSAFIQDPKQAVFVKALTTAKPRAYGPNYPKISNYVQQAFQAAISGQKSASAALQAASQSVKPLLPS
ncbi:ABC transporter substrate-binding protein [Ktedonobacter sp. SOSP1-52]|uniref:ABC transporter substrate-binding protein n=1 Tax=Ktedonobacter sp. SOSP1-52 TaxID=2778366 RepID=UPI001916193A|nr:sugar ABC transporter substrate-binding protein [Ktedonobacter sp. SOSP1-52]GHO66958.1 ABC transporter substrate-binding protein [Ktedonobacter sp. SOSP1-52]